MSPDTLSLDSKVAIVTGSGRENGIGAAIARSLARNGAAVTIHHVSDSSAPRAEKVAKQIRDAGGKATIVQANVNTLDGAKMIVAETLSAFGADKIDILVNNAGGSDFKSLMDTTPEEVVTGFALNTFGPLYLAQSVVGVGKMPQGGRIINIGTVASKLGITGMGVYGAAKAATDSLTESLAQELGRSHGITVNTVAPGPVKTDITINAEVDLGMDITEPLRAKARGSDRLADPEDIADVVAWVASEKARWITAQFISASSGINGTS